MAYYYLGKIVFWVRFPVSAPSFFSYADEICVGRTPDTNPDSGSRINDR